MALEIRPITLKDANAYVAAQHRHNRPTTGHKWSVAVYDGERLCGVAIAGRPIARKQDDGLTIEIRRVCTDGTRNACSMLYGACVRAARAMGYKRVVTYTLVSEPGASLKASGFQSSGEAGGGILEYALPPTQPIRTDNYAGDGAGSAEIPEGKENQMGKTILGGHMSEFLTPITICAAFQTEGTSRNGRRFTPEAVKKALAEMKAMPIIDTSGDEERIVGMVDGKAYEIEEKDGEILYKLDGALFQIGNMKKKGIGKFEYVFSAEPGDKLIERFSIVKVVVK